MRECDCGCGLAVPPDRSGRRRFATAACRARAHRRRSDGSERPVAGASPVVDEALSSLKERKDVLGNALHDPDRLTPAELSRLSSEFRLTVESILRVERSRPVEQPAKVPTFADELRARRNARLEAARERAAEAEQ